MMQPRPCSLVAVTACLVLTPSVRGADGFPFVQPGLGVAVALSDGTYQGYVDASFEFGASGGYLFALPGGEAFIGPEAIVSYTVHDIDDDYEDHLDADAYAGRFRLLGGARFQVDLGGPYVFCRFAIGLDWSHASWEYRLLPGEDDESDAGLALQAGFGFGARVSDGVAVGMILDFPMSIHDDTADGGVDYDVDSLDVELTLAVTIFL